MAIIGKDVYFRILRRYLVNIAKRLDVAKKIQNWIHLSQQHLTVFREFLISIQNKDESQLAASSCKATTEFYTYRCKRRQGCINKLLRLGLRRWIARITEPTIFTSLARRQIAKTIKLQHNSSLQSK